jgi:hypothetical protein
VLVHRANKGVGVDAVFGGVIDSFEVKKVINLAEVLHSENYESIVARKCTPCQVVGVRQRMLADDSATITHNSVSLHIFL